MSTGVVFQSTLQRACKSTGINYDFSFSVLICLRNSSEHSRVYYAFAGVGACAGGVGGGKGAHKVKTEAITLLAASNSMLIPGRHNSRKYTSESQQQPQSPGPRDFGTQLSLHQHPIVAKC